MWSGVAEFGALTRNQRSLFWAQLVESFGAFGLVSAFTLWASTRPGGPAHTASLVSWVIAANTVPRMLLAPLVARTAHRFDEARILQCANLARALVCVVGVLALGLRRLPGTVLVVTIVLVLGCFDQFFGPVRAAAAQRNLREHERVHYGALSFLALAGIGLVSSATTPTIFAAGGVRLWLWIGTCCSLVSVMVLAVGYSSRRDLTPRPPRAQRARIGTLTMARFALTGRHGVSLVTWSLVGYGLALGLTSQSMALLALDGLRVPIHRYGWIPAGFAVGGLGAWMLTRSLARRWSPTTNLSLGAVLLALGYLGYAASPGLICCVAAMLLAGVGFGLWSGVQGAILQAVVPNDRMAGYVAVTGTMSLLANLAGSQLGRRLVRSAAHHGHALGGYRLSYVIAALSIIACATLRGTGARSTAMGAPAAGR